MNRWLARIVPVILAIMLASVIFFMVGGTPPHISASDLQRIQRENPKAQVSRFDQGKLLLVEQYGKPIARQFRVQALMPGFATLFDNDGKPIMKMFMDQGDILVTIPKGREFDAVAFEPFEWLE